MNLSTEAKTSFENCGIKLAKGFFLKPGKRITYEQPVEIASKLVVLCDTVIGGFTYFNSGRIKSLHSIGRYCSVAHNVMIGEAEHPLDWLSTSSFQYNGKRFGWHSVAVAQSANPFTPQQKKIIQKFAPIIGNDVWIGACVNILRGVKIGSGAIIAAGAVVVKDVEPYSIVGGVPARHLRYRFPEEIRSRLLNLEWWNFDADQLRGISFSDIELAIVEIERRIEQGELVLRPQKKNILTEGRIFPVDD